MFVGALENALPEVELTRVQISHFKLPTDVAKRIGGSDATLKRVTDARAAGQEVWVDQYPYTASSTGLNTFRIRRGAYSAR